MTSSTRGQTKTAPRQLNKYKWDIGLLFQKTRTAYNLYSQVVRGANGAKRDNGRICIHHIHTYGHGTEKIICSGRFSPKRRKMEKERKKTIQYRGMTEFLTIYFEYSLIKKSTWNFGSNWVYWQLVLQEWKFSFRSLFKFNILVSKEKQDHENHAEGSR